MYPVALPALVFAPSLGIVVCGPLLARVSPSQSAGPVGTVLGYRKDRLSWVRKIQEIQLENKLPQEKSQLSDTVCRVYLRLDLPPTFGTVDLAVPFASC